MSREERGSAACGGGPAPLLATLCSRSRLKNYHSVKKLGLMLLFIGKMHIFVVS